LAEKEGSPASPLSAQWSHRVAAGAAALCSLAYWASGSLFPPPAALAYAPLAS